MAHCSGPWFQADVFFDNRNRDGVMTWINGVTELVVVSVCVVPMGRLTNLA